MEKANTCFENTKINVLIVDDSKDILDMCTDILQIKNYNIITAANGFDAIKNYVKYEPDVIIIDQIMPGIQGTEIARKMMKMDVNAKIIIMTAYMSKLDLSKKERAIIPVLTKPFEQEDIIDVIESMIDLKNVKKDNESKMISVLIDDDIYTKIIQIQSEKIQEKKQSYSFSKTVNDILKEIV